MIHYFCCMFAKKEAFYYYRLAISNIEYQSLIIIIYIPIMLSLYSISNKSFSDNNVKNTHSLFYTLPKHCGNYQQIFSHSNIHFQQSPFLLQHKPQNNFRKTLLSPTATSSKYQRINFSYVHKDSLQPISKDSEIFERGGQRVLKKTTDIESLKYMRTLIKRNRNRLCSGVNVFIFIPEINRFDETRSLNKVWSIKSFNLIEDQGIVKKQQINKQTKQSYMNRSTQHSTITSQSKMVQTQASISGIMTHSIAKYQLKSSALLIPTSKRLYQHSKSTNPNHPFSHKIIANTLSNLAYHFGGIVNSTLNQSDNQNNVTVAPKEIQFIGNGDWSNCVRGLLYDEQQSDLKESIHCGPEIRLESIRLEMLENFGRSIKQSTFEQE